MLIDVVTLIANVSLALSFVVALIFGIAQLKSWERDRRERLTLETLHNFQSREFAELIHYITTHDMPKTTDEMQKLSSEERIMFIQYSQMMESLGMLVAENYINIDLVDKTLGNFVSITWKKYEPVLLDMRKSSDPYAGEYFQWLAERIDERLGKNPRKPFFVK